MKGVMLPRYGNVMNIMRMGSNVDAMICLLLLGEVEGGGQSNCIVVQLPWSKCSKHVCGKKARENGIQ
jgi:hypothetical protein